MDPAALAESMATRTRSAAYAPQWSIAIRQQNPMEERRPVRVVANKAQLTILRALYARAGEHATKSEIEEVVRATGLETRWVRKWIKRQQAKTRGRTSDASNGGSASTDTDSRLPSPEERATTTTTSQAVLHLQVTPNIPPPQEFVPADTPTCSARAPVPLTFPPPAHPDSLHHLDVTTARPAAFRSAHATTFQQLSGPCSPGIGVGTGGGFSSGAAYTCAAGSPSATMHLPSASLTDPLAAQLALPAASFSVPLRPGTPPFCTGASPYHQAPTALSVSPTPGNILEDPLNFGTTGFPVNIALSPADVPGGVPDTIAPAELCISPFAPPSGLTASAAYLYELFHDSTTASTAAPPEAPPFNSASFLPGLTRPSNVPDLRAPLSAFASTPQPVCYPGYPGMAPYPLSYQMRLSDLMALTKAIRLAAASSDSTHAQDAVALGEAGQDGSAEREVAMDVEVSQLQYSRANASSGDGGPAALDALGNSPAGTIDDGDETEEEAEVVTPCEETHFNLSYGVEANDMKKTLDSAGTGVVEVADVTMDD